MTSQGHSVQTWRHFFAAVLFAGLSGCAATFPNATVAQAAKDPVAKPTARDWVAQLPRPFVSAEPPARSKEALTTEELTVDGQPINVGKRFNLRFGYLDNLLLNSRGISDTSASASHGNVRERPQWPGFEDVAVPVSGNAVLWGRLGIPDKEREIPGSYVIITHGLFGCLDGPLIGRQIETLRRAGHHVLAMEMRGHGMTHILHPDYPITFGQEDCCDFLAAARWLKSTHGATRVGLVSFSLTGFEALLAGWIDGREPVVEFAGRPLQHVVPTRESTPAFNGGMFIVSAPVGILGTADRFDPKLSIVVNPVKAKFQDLVSKRLAEFKQPPGYSMWDLARGEFPRSDLHNYYPTFEAARPDLARYVDFSQDHWKVGAARMENIRVPVLVISAANDPLETGQDVADLFSRQHNPNIGVILFKEGGHIGFMTHCPEYYLLLMRRFFDPVTGPAIGGS
jgi:predicted alpha/beta-fold hydrolase